jgi:hypothetical protein
VRLAQQSGSRALPTTLPTIPRVQQIGKPVIHEATNRADHQQPGEPPEPDVTGRSGQIAIAQSIGVPVSASTACSLRLMSLTPMPKPDSASGPD